MTHPRIYTKYLSVFYLILKNIFINEIPKEMNKTSKTDGIFFFVDHILNEWIFGQNHTRFQRALTEGLSKDKNELLIN